MNKQLDFIAKRAGSHVKEYTCNSSRTVMKGNFLTIPIKPVHQSAIMTLLGFLNFFFIKDLQFPNLKYRLWPVTGVL